MFFNTLIILYLIINFKFYYKIVIYKFSKNFINKSKYIVKKYLSKKYNINYINNKVKFIVINIKQV